MLKSLMSAALIFGLQTIALGGNAVPGEPTGISRGDLRNFCVAETIAPRRKDGGRKDISCPTGTVMVEINDVDASFATAHVEIRCLPIALHKSCIRGVVDAKTRALKRRVGTLEKKVRDLEDIVVDLVANTIAP